MAKSKKKKQRSSSGPAASTANRQANRPKAEKPASTATKGRPTPSRNASPPKSSKQKGALVDRLSWVAVGAGAIAIVVFVVILVLGSAPEGGDVEAESFDLPALDGGGRVGIGDFTGEPLVVNFFASWCVACDAELPFFRNFAEQLEGDVEFLFVNSNESGNWRPMAERHDLLRYPLARDINGTNDNGLVRSLGGSTGMPMTAFYDDAGNLLHVERGAVSGGQLAGLLTDFYGVQLT